MNDNKTFVIVLLLSHLVYYLVITKETGTLINNKFEKSESDLNQDDHSRFCKDKVDFVWCIPPHYSKREEPWRYRYMMNATFPWTYNFRFHIFDIQEVDDMKQTLSISMYFIIKWLEPRLIINEAAKDWNDLNYGLTDTVDIAPEYLKYFWNPDLEIYGMESFNSKTILKEMSSLKILKTHHIEYMARVDITISCRMSFDQYPLDHQECPFRIGSYYSAEDTVNCNDSYKYIEERQRSLQYSIKIGSLPIKDRRYFFDSKSYAVCGINIYLRRTRKQTFFQVYLTSILFVVVSWVSFIIRPEVVPGRMGLLVMIFLILINTFNSAKYNAPTSTTLNEVDLYLLMCIGIVFMALMEYAVVLLKERCKVDLTTSSPTEQQSKPKLITLTSITQDDKTTAKVVQPSWEEQHLSSMNKLDYISLVVFPIFFIAFNVIYFSVHA
jgi:hypothetical protein